MTGNVNNIPVNGITLHYRGEAFNGIDFERDFQQK